MRVDIYSKFEHTKAPGQNYIISQLVILIIINIVVSAWALKYKESQYSS